MDVNLICSLLVCIFQGVGETSVCCLGSVNLEAIEGSTFQYLKSLSHVQRVRRFNNSTKELDPACLEGLGSTNLPGPVFVILFLS